MNLTVLEKDVMRAIGENQYSDYPGAPVWSFAIEYHTVFTNKHQISGVVSSLIKKGIVVSEGDGKDSVVCLTKQGILEYEEIKEV